MSLLRRLWLSIGVLLITVFAVTMTVFGVSGSNTLQEQLAIETQNTARSLAQVEAHAAATDASSSRPPAPTVDEAFAALADGVDDVDREIAEDERARERLLSADSAVDEEFAALADGLGDVDEPPTEQAEFAALADGLGGE